MFRYTQSHTQRPFHPKSSARPRAAFWVIVSILSSLSLVAAVLLPSPSAYADASSVAGIAKSV